MVPDLSPEKVEIFLQRARIDMDRLRQRSTSQVVALRDCGRLHGGPPYFVIRRAPGTSLLRLVTRHGGLAADAALPILERLVACVADAHRAGLV